MAPLTRHEQIRHVRAAFGDWPKAVGVGTLWKALPLPPASTVLHTRGGTRIACPLRPDAGALYTALEVFAFGSYDPVGALGPSPFVIDVGANIGAFVLWVHERAPGVRGVAFEPDPLAREFLRRNLELNAITSVEVSDAAVGAQQGTATLHRHGDGGGLSTLNAAAAADGGLRESLDVPVTAFDELIASLGDQPIDVVKLDCEGSEHDIVMDSSPASWRRVRRVALEYHPVAGRSVAALEGRLRELGFGVDAREGADELGMLWLSRVRDAA